jgi:hypothetical protein
VAGRDASEAGGKKQSECKSPGETRHVCP